ncbi:MAG: rhomboid family intramembrane serine protease [Hyphomicrobiaceae bacterium]|nr:rhomboid family intramembrane serine protease [Hyphomicrobiaceae bacterium]
MTALVFVVQTILPARLSSDLTIDFGMIPVVVRNAFPQPLPWLPDQVPLVTYAFLHADWLHLLSNMLFLFIFGDNVEDALGHVKFIIFYLACAVIAALTYTFVFPDSMGPLIGASGAVAGVLGAYALLYPHARVFVLARLVWLVPLPLPAMWMLGIWFLTQIFYAFAGSEEPIAWWAHVGGVIAGAILVLPLKRREVPLFGGK